MLHILDEHELRIKKLTLKRFKQYCHYSVYNKNIFKNEELMSKIHRDVMHHYEIYYRIHIHGYPNPQKHQFERLGDDIMYEIKKSLDLNYYRLITQKGDRYAKFYETLRIKYNLRANMYWGKCRVICHFYNENYIKKNIIEQKKQEDFIHKKKFNDCFKCFLRDFSCFLYAFIWVICFIVTPAILLALIL